MFPDVDHDCLFHTSKKPPAFGRPTHWTERLFRCRLSPVLRPPLAHAAPNREPRKYEARYQHNRNAADNRHEGSHFTEDTLAQVHVA